MSMNVNGQQNSYDEQTLADVSYVAQAAYSTLRHTTSMLAEGTAGSFTGRICLQDCDIFVTVEARMLLSEEREARLALLVSESVQGEGATPPKRKER